MLHPLLVYPVTVIYSLALILTSYYIAPYIIISLTGAIAFVFHKVHRQVSILPNDGITPRTDFLHGVVVRDGNDVLTMFDQEQTYRIQVLAAALKSKLTNKTSRAAEEWKKFSDNFTEMLYKWAREEDNQLFAAVNTTWIDEKARTRTPVMGVRHENIKAYPAIRSGLIALEELKASKEEQEIDYSRLHYGTRSGPSTAKREGSVRRNGSSHRYREASYDRELDYDMAAGFFEEKDERNEFKEEVKAILEKSINELDWALDTDKLDKDLAPKISDRMEELIVDSYSRYDEMKSKAINLLRRFIGVILLGISVGLASITGDEKAFAETSDAQEEQLIPYQVLREAPYYRT